MCTVLYLPGKGRHFFASLRDESPKRLRAFLPEIVGHDNINILAPIDPVAGGTWIGVNNLGHVIILLNGAFNNHQKKNSYLKSRGLIVSELLNSVDPVMDWNEMDLEKIEPFTLIVWRNADLFQLVWDGLENHRGSLDPAVPYIWSSSTLYDAAAKNQRQTKFLDWVSMKPELSSSTVLDFFRSYTENENGFMMNRSEGLKTLSYTFIELQQELFAELRYHDLLLNTLHQKNIGLNKKSNHYKLKISDPC